MMRAVLCALLLAGCRPNYPRLPAPTESVPVDAPTRIGVLDLLRVRDPTGSATAAAGVWDTSLSASSRGRTARSAHDAGILGYRLLQLRPDALALDDRPLVPLVGGSIPSAAVHGFRIPALLDELAVWKAAAEEAAELQVRPDFTATLAIEADASTSSDVLVPAVYTAGLAGFTHIQLLGTRDADLHRRPDDPAVEALVVHLPSSDEPGPAEPTQRLCASGASGQAQDGVQGLFIGPGVPMHQVVASVQGLSERGRVVLVGMGTPLCESP